MQLGAVLKCDRLKAFGAAVDWFCWLDEQCENGCTHLTPKQVDEVLGIKRMSDALVHVGWASVGADGLVYVTDFDQHNGETAKSRAQHANRQEKYKNSKRGDAKGDAVSVSEASTDASADASPRIIYRDIDTKGELSSTVDMNASACPCPPPSDFGDWLKAVGAAVPMLRRLNLDKPLPRAVEAEARKAAELVPLTEADREMLRRYYAAMEVKTYRPDSLERFFRDLPDVLQHAANWCKADDRAQRKAAATARRKAREDVLMGEGVVCTDEERNAFLDSVRRDFRLEGNNG